MKDIRQHQLVQRCVRWFLSSRVLRPRPAPLRIRTWPRSSAIQKRRSTTPIGRVGTRRWPSGSGARMLASAGRLDRWPTSTTIRRPNRSFRRSTSNSSIESPMEPDRWSVSPSLTSSRETTARIGCTVAPNSHSPVGVLLRTTSPFGASSLRCGMIARDVPVYRGSTENRIELGVQEFRNRNPVIDQQCVPKKPYRAFFRSKLFPLHFIIN